MAHRIRQRLAALAGASLVFSAGEAQAVVSTTTIAGSRALFACTSTSASDERSGLYLMPDGGYVCLQNYDELLLLKGPEVGAASAFEVDLEWKADGPFELSGVARISGWGFVKQYTPAGLIATAVDCPFETEMRAKFLSGGDILLERPIVQYDTETCDFLSQLRRTEVLKRM